MKKIIFTVMVLSLAIFGCSKKEIAETKNMNQMYAENGIPVKVSTIETQEYSVELPFSATVSGLRQSYASAMIGGRIEKIMINVGDYVNADQIIMEFPEDAPSGNYTQAKNAFELAESTYNKMKNIFEIGGISQLELDQVKTQYEVNKANFDAVSQLLKVRAPISGYVTSIAVHETDGVHKEAILATISQTKKLKARVWITEDEISMMKRGQEATFDWNGIVLEGKVTEVGMAMDPGRNAFGIDVQFDNSKNLVKSGVIGDVKITTYKNPTALVIERKNVMKDENGKYVFVAKNGVAKKTYIKTGNENGSFEVLEGVNIGDKVVVSSLNLVSDNAKVKY